MNILTRDELGKLMAEEGGFRVSLYMPTHRAGLETQQNPIRFKNLLRKAEEDLLARGVGAVDVDRMLKPAMDMLSNGMFWHNQSDGLAVFLSRNTSYAHRLPLSFEETALVSERFYIKPLLPLLSGDGGYYVLALSRNEVRLFQCTRHNVSEIELKGLPKSLGEAVEPEGSEEQRLQKRPATTTRGQAGAFHGHGDTETEEKTKLEKFFRIIDKGLRTFLKDESSPLVLAGVDYLFPIYREANSHPHLLEAGLEGNPETLSAEDLHGRAWELVEPGFKREQKLALEKYWELRGSGRTSKNLREVVRAAHGGKVEYLFVDICRRQWGRLVPETGDVKLHRRPEQGDHDLLDFAAVKTLLGGGTVYALDSARVPQGAAMAAVFRY